MFSLQIESGTRYQTINLHYKNDENIYVAFLPSYANGDNVKLKTNSTLFCNGKKYRNYDSIDDFELNKPYNFTYKGSNDSFDVVFIKSDNIGTIFAELDEDALASVYAKEEGRAKICIYTADGNVEFADYNTAKLEGRGNSTWWDLKKPFNIKLANKETLFGMNSNDKWVLLANFFDGTNMRNALVYSCASKTGLRDVSPDYRYVDFYMNGKYMGLYMLTQKLGKTVYNSLPDGSYLLETFVDNLRIGEDKPYFQINTGWDYAVNYPKNCSSEQLAEIKQIFESFVKSLQSGTDEWKNLIDVDSFARRCLLDEFFLNIDMDRLSCFYYYDSGKEKIFAGPVWDYDLTMWYGNRRYFMNRTDTVNGFNDSNVYSLLYNNSDFMERMKEIYINEFYPAVKSVINNELANIPPLIHSSDYMDGIVYQKNSARSGRQNALTDIQGYEYLCNFLNNRSEFLLGLFSDMESYHKIKIYIDGRKEYGFLFVKHGEKLAEFDPPFDYEGNKMDCLVDIDTGRTFDFSSPIYRDLELEILYEKKPEVIESAPEQPQTEIVEEVSAEVPELGFFERHSAEALVGLLMAVIITVFTFVLFVIDYKKNWKGHSHKSDK